MKTFFVIALLAMCSFISAATERGNLAKSPQNSMTNLLEQTGFAALNFPKQVTIHNVESLGLSLSAEFNDINSKQHSWTNDTPENIYQLTTATSSSAGANISAINASYSNGNFTAETGVFSNNESLTSSSQFYLQGAYQLFTGEHLAVSLTAKIEAIDNDSINSYLGYQENYQAYKSVFEQQATNTTIGLVSTYRINKQWQIHGMISSTSLDDKIENSPLINSNSIQIALIGTSYSF